MATDVVPVSPLLVQSRYTEHQLELVGVLATVLPNGSLTISLVAGVVPVLVRLACQPMPMSA